MKQEERKKLVVSMEMLCRAVNYESILDSWLMCGVPDGDIPVNSLDTSYVDEYFLDDKHFAELMGLFLRIMSRASKSGGLYFDRVVSK